MEIKMRRHTKFALTLLVALPFGAAAHAACNPGHVGTSADCPDYTAPATVAVPGPSMNGSAVTNGFVTLFNGVVPPNGFMVQINESSSVGTRCNVSDDGPAAVESRGFLFGGIWVETPLPNMFVTPPGYKPIGPVTVACSGGIYVEARGW
jgi:hypothetical protein